MARQVLENGVILPAEYSDDWYDDMSSNLTKLDDVIGSDSEKLSSADVGAAALSNNYNDLDNLPTIPTVNNATLTIQKNGVDVQTFTANASSNVTCNITVPTKTSDLTNDSNFVDTSNSAVASGITSAKVTSYDSHIADTDIHVTTADKTKWNNGVTQSYVFRYSSTALVASSTNSNTLLDNTDNLKVGDKIIDSDGVLFSITAIDIVNSTFTIGSALIDLAKDSDVVHKSRNETVAGIKTFSNDIIKGSASTNSTIQTRNLIGSTTASTTGSNSNSYQSITATLNYSDSTPSKSTSVSLYVNENAYDDGKYNGFSPNSNNTVNLGTSGKRWANVYATKYYYGSDNTEFSTKFVTSDTAQTISGTKTFDVNLPFKNSAELGVSGGSTNITFSDKNGQQIGAIKSNVYSSGVPAFLINLTQKVDNTIYTTNGIAVYQQANSKVIQVRPILANDNVDGLSVWLGSSVNTFSRIYGLSYYYGNANVEFSTKFVTTDTNQTILGNKTFSSINGVEPSSLSLPSDRSARIDISSYITNLGNGDNNSYVVPANGYIWLHFTSINSALCYSQTPGGLTNYAQTFVRYSGDGQLYAFFPVRKDDYFIVQIYTSSTAVVQNAYFIPCQGNV